MSSYFDEHNCEEGSRPDGLLQLARLLVDTGEYQRSGFNASSFELVPNFRALSNQLASKPTC